MNQKQIESISKIKDQRTKQFIEQYCEVGTFMSDGAYKVTGVCRHVDATEVVNYMSVTIALILEALKENEGA